MKFRAAAAVGAAVFAGGAVAPITIRTETYARPPYSSATYYIYEQAGQVICTKVQACNKYDQCQTAYRRGPFKDEAEARVGPPYDKTKPVLIAADKLGKHLCLTKLGIAKP